MPGRRGNNLIVIENGQLTNYNLDDRIVWEIGRPTQECIPDIILHSATVSRRHGRFQNIDGMWFYVDSLGKNGTIYNGKPITGGIRGRVKPVTLKDGDTLIFGGGEKPEINSRTVWALFSERYFDELWRLEDTKGYDRIAITDGDQTTIIPVPIKGSVINRNDGMAIYMGDVTWLAGNISITRN